MPYVLFGLACVILFAACGSERPEYLWPLEELTFNITSNFGPRPNPWNRSEQEFHTGLDMGADLGAPVLATTDGQVTEVFNDPSGYGLRIVVTHYYGGLHSTYNHLDSSAVAVGAEVVQGQIIGTVGSTGRSTGAHLHFELVDAEGNFLDPIKYLPEFKARWC